MKKRASIAKQRYGPYIKDIETRDMEKEFEAILKVSRFKLLQIFSKACGYAKDRAHEFPTWEDLDDALIDEQSTFAVANKGIKDKWVDPANP